MSTVAIVPAAGRGERLGPGPPKALREVAGAPLLLHAVRHLAGSGVVDAIVVLAPRELTGAVQQMLHSAGDDVRLTVVPGGDTREQSVAAGLAVLPDTADVVLVHDAARAFAPAALTRRVVRAVREGAVAVVPVVPVADTVKRVGAGVVEATVDRSALRAVQTPQGFRPDVLARAHARAADTATAATDDAGLVEALGLPVTVVDGADEAFKVTRPLDLLLAEALLRARPTPG